MSAAGRRIRRVAGSALFIVILAGALGGALLTRFPDAALVERAAQWPLVGGALRAFREWYLPPPAVPGEAAASRPEVVVVVSEARPTVWVDEGTILRTGPDEAAEAVATVDALTNLPLVEQYEEWAWVDFRGVMGWVVPRASVDHGPALGSRPDPVLPIVARPPEAPVLERGLEGFSGQPSEHPFGGYRLYTDWPGSHLLDRCRQLEEDLEEAYVDLFGLTPIGQPAEVVLLFSQKVDYDSFWRETTGQRIEAVGHAGRGVVATYVGLRPPQEICTTVIHELAHLLNRRALGPALPPWLEEGMATEIAARHAAGSLEPRVVRLAARRGSLPSLEDLLELDREEFHAAGLRRLHYQQSALWLRFLLEDPRLGERLLTFLAYLARGGPYAPGLRADELPAARATPTLADDLGAILDEDLEALDERFRRWMEIE